MKAKRITAEHLLNDYRTLKQSLGRRPTCIEFAKRRHNISLLVRYFGNPGWSSLVKAAGDTAGKAPLPTRDEVIEGFHRLKKELGRTPSSAEYAARQYRLGILQKVFGRYGWNSLLKAAGERPRFAAFVTRQMLIDDYRALKKKLGRQPKLAEFNEACYGTGVLNRKFGAPAWPRLLKAAGDQPLVMVNLPAKHLIADFLHLQEKLGRRPKLLEYTYQCHTPKVLDRVFGKPGWNKLIEAVGTKAKPKDILTEDHLLQDFLDTWKELNRIPKQEEFRLRCHHTTKVFDRVFGKPGFRNLVRAASKLKRNREQR